MARRERIVLAELPHHVIQRGNNRAPTFFDEEDYERYKETLLACAVRFGCVVHAYCLMTNHVHLLVTPSKKNALSAMMQTLGSTYVRYINIKYRRTGTLWEGRFKVSPIDADEYLFSCMRYIENNPVRARMVRSPKNYPWSSFRANALGEADRLVTPHALYMTLGKNCARSYAALFQRDGNTEIDDIRSAINGNWALSAARFVKMVEKKSGAHAAPKARGGDRKSEKFREKR